MISIVCAIMFVVLCSALSAVYVAYLYERRGHRDAKERYQSMRANYSRILAENCDLNVAMAEARGRAIGRGGDGLQRKVEESLRAGQPVSIRMGPRFEQDA